MKATTLALPGCAPHRQAPLLGDGAVRLFTINERIKNFGSTHRGIRCEVRTTARVLNAPFVRCSAVVQHYMSSPVQVHELLVATLHSPSLSLFINDCVSFECSNAFDLIALAVTFP